MVGQTIGKYRVEDRIGRGGMGTVYRALDETLHREVAIKVLNSELNDPEVAKRFRAEAITVARLSHPGIATVYELFEHDGQWLMVMEFVKGETLERLIERAGPLTAERAADLAMQALSALSHAHGLGVVHRDLKPANLMLTDVGTVKIMDFGIARVSGSEHLTSAGFMMGTPAYMAPEQVLGHEVDARADLYAMGVVLYRLTTGKLPFKGETPFALAQSQVNDPPTPVRTAREGLPIWLEQVIGRSLSKAPGDRFQTAADFRESLKRCLSGLPMETPDDSMAPTGMMMTPPGLPTGLLRTPTSSTAPRIVPVPPAGGSTAGVPVSGTASTPQPPAPADMPTTASGVHAMATPADNSAYAATTLQRVGTGQIPTTTPSGAIPMSGAQPIPGSPVGTGAQPMPGAPFATGAQPSPTGAQMAYPSGAVPMATGPQAVAPTGATPKPARSASSSSSTMNLIAAAAVILVLIVGGFAMMWWRHRAAPPAEPAPVATTAQAPAADATTPAASTTPPVVGTQPPPTSATPAPTPPPTTPTPAPVATSNPSTAAPATPPSSTGAPTTRTPSTTGAGATGRAGTNAAGRAGATPPPFVPADDSFLAFKDIKYLSIKDQDTQDQDAHLNFGSGQILVVPKDGGSALATVPYRSVLRVTYAHTKDPKWDATLPAPPDNLNIHGFMRGTRHWLVFQTKTDYTIVRLDDSNWTHVLETVESRTGLKVDRQADGGGR